jgi:hypothetical protein
VTSARITAAEGKKERHGGVETTPAALALHPPLWASAAAAGGDGKQKPFSQL